MSANACARQTVPTGVSPIASNAAQSGARLCGLSLHHETGRAHEARSCRARIAADDSIEQLQRAAEIMTVLQDVGLQQQQRRRDVWLGEPRLQYRFGASEIPRLALGSGLVDVARSHALRHSRVLSGSCQLFPRMPGGRSSSAAGNCNTTYPPSAGRNRCGPCAACPAGSNASRASQLTDPIPQWQLSTGSKAAGSFVACVYPGVPRDFGGLRIG